MYVEMSEGWCACSKFFGPEKEALHQPSDISMYCVLCILCMYPMIFQFDEWNISEVVESRNTLNMIECP